MAREREEEARKLQEELEATKMKMDEKQKELEEALNRPPVNSHVYEHDNDENDDEDKQEYGTSPLSLCNLLYFYPSIISLCRMISSNRSPLSENLSSVFHKTVTLYVLSA